MFFDSDVRGRDLPPQTLCLTYDDGPGVGTAALGRFLHEQGVGATFFVIGRHAEGQADLLRQLAAWGHLIGNHTYTHPGLVALALAGGDVVGELTRTEEVIREHIAGGRVLFRAPYGNWREKQAPGSPHDRPTSIVAALLNRSPRLQNHVGPINWDISAADYEFWDRGAGAEECAAAYLEKIERVGRGIVLMHDSCAEERPRANNRTTEVTRLLVPVLKEKGYRFVRLDEVPQVRSALAAAQPQSAGGL
jgi:peptidoglycan/xylan/chitin deacetylase (PgdA/CDA1 family)